LEEEAHEAVGGLSAWLTKGVERSLIQCVFVVCCCVVFMQRKKYKILANPILINKKEHKVSHEKSQQ